MMTSPLAYLRGVTARFCLFCCFDVFLCVQFVFFINVITTIYFSFFFLLVFVIVIEHYCVFHAEHNEG